MDMIDHLLTRGVDKIYPSKEVFEKVLRSGKKLKLYQGFDPTGTQLHIGHMVALKKLREFQELGHHVIFLIGDGTGQAGDPSGKLKTREKFFNQEELRQNAKDYVMQASKILRFEGENPVQILYNGDWLNKLGLVDILNIVEHFSVQQFLERDMYQERMKKNESINLREFLYPILQGYDSVAMEVDLELGGSDQTFNMLVGRTLVSQMLHKEKFVMTVPLLTDAKGVKIGKSEGNVIGLVDEPQNLYGKIMSLGDDAIINCFTLLTDKTDTQIQEMKQAIDEGENPMVFKKQLAYELVEQLHSKEKAVSAQEFFEKTFQKGEVGEIPTFTLSQLSSTKLSIVDLLIETQSAESKSAAKRLIEQKAIEVDQTIVDIVHTTVELKSGMVLKVGKKRFLKFV